MGIALSVVETQNIKIMFESKVLCKSYKTRSILKAQLTKYIKAQEIEREYVRNTKGRFYLGELKINVLRTLEQDLINANQEFKANQQAINENK